MTDSSEQRSETNYRWVVLALGAATFTFVVAIPTMCMPVLFKEISDDLGLSLVQIGVVWGIGSLSGIFSSLIGGTIGDRFGARRTIMIASILLAFAGAIRGLAVDYATMLITVLLFGLIAPSIPTNVHKTCGIWFSKRQLGLANGVVAMGMALGFMLGSMISATILSPLLGGWRYVLFLYGAIALVVGILWNFIKAPPKKATTEEDRSEVSSLREALFHVLRIRKVWLYGILLLGFNGCVQGVLGYLPLYLREMGWAPAIADGTLAGFHGASMAFVLPLAILSDRIGRRKPILVTATLVLTIGVGLLTIAQGNLIWGLVLLVGLFRDGFMAVLVTTIIESEGIGQDYSGSAVGLAMLFSSIGSIISPPIGNSIAEQQLNAPFLFWAGMAALAFIASTFIKERKTQLETHT
jgi:predicted MFS family arabinose efflux permease